MGHSTESTPLFDASSFPNETSIRASSTTTPDVNSIFTQKENAFGQQYSHIYMHRLAILRPILMEKVKSHDNILGKIIDLKMKESCTIIGTLYKCMPNKPCILNEITEESAVTDNFKESYTSEKDTLVLEDESGRVALLGEIPVEALATGIVIAVSGTMVNGDGFEVKEWWNVGLPTQIPPSLTEDDKYVVLVSGLEMGKNENPFGMQLLVDYLAGRIGNKSEQNFVSKITRVIVAGNSVNVTMPPDTLRTADARKLAAEERAISIKHVDLLMAQLAATMPVDIMPGLTDPSNFTLPQQAMHKCLFPVSGRFSSFNLVSNPYRTLVDGIDFLCASGQSINSLKQCVSGLDTVACLEATLQWRHIAPIAPDALGCYPSKDSDPFVLTTCPHVYFTGNETTFTEKEVVGDNDQRVRVIGVPSFAATGSVVVCNLKDMSCTCITIQL